MTSDHTRDAADHAAEHRRATQIGPAGPAPEPLLAPPAAALLGAGLLAHPDLPRRGNEPVRAAVLQRLQRTHGNRAVSASFSEPPPLTPRAPARGAGRRRRFAGRAARP